MKQYFHRIAIIFTLLAVLFLACALYAGYMTAGMRLLTAHSSIGQYYIYYPILLIIAIFFTAVGVIFGIVHQKFVNKHTNADTGKCPACGTENKEIHQFCKTCGQPLQSTEELSTQY